MKILLSAYACEPNKGSEPGVGWSWATEYAKQHQVWVGLPCIAIATGGPGILLDEFKESTVIGDNYEECVDKISKCIEELLADEQKRQQQSTLLRKSIQEKFVLKKKCEMILQLLK